MIPLRCHVRSPLSLLTAAAILAATAACSGGDDTADPDGTAGDDGAVTSTTVTVPDGGSVPDTTAPADGSTSTMPPEPGECPADALPDDGSPVEITFWHSMSATTGVVLEELLADYNAAQDRVRVTPVFQGGYADTFGKYVNTVRSGGDLPSLVQLSEIYLQQMVDSETVVPVQDCVDAAGYDLSDFSASLLDQYRIDGELVTMPFQLANPVLFYDGNDFVAAGLDPAAPPETLDELVATSRTLVESGVPSALAMNVDAWPFEQWVTTAGDALVDHDNGRTGRAETSLLDTDTVVDILTTLRAMHDDGLLLVTGGVADQASLARFLAVAQGDASMTIASSASLGEIYQQIALVPDVDVRVGPFPGLGGSTSVGGGSIYLTSETTAEQRAAAWDLLAWLDEPAQQVRWSIGTGYVPTRRSAADDPELVALWEERPGFRVAWDQLSVEGEVPGGAGPVIGDYLGVRAAIEAGLESLYAGGDPAAVAAEMQDGADRAMADYNRRIGG
jgi:sn-glycerol 3-phosphate transport system substrate-binding protein